MEAALREIVLLCTIGHIPAVKHHVRLVDDCILGIFYCGNALHIRVDPAVLILGKIAEIGVCRIQLVLSLVKLTDLVTGILNKIPYDPIQLRSL